MPLPLILALLAPADPASALVHAEAVARRTVVAMPILQGFTPGLGESVADYAARADGAFVPIEEGLARPDRPLLISPRSVYDALAIQALPILGPLGRAYGTMTNLDVETMRRTGAVGLPPGEGESPMFRGGFSIAAMPEADQRTVASVMGDYLGNEGLQPSDRLLTVNNPILTVTRPDGTSFLMTIPSDGKPYDAGPILAKYRLKDPDPVPDALRRAVGDRTVPTPAAPLALADWARLLSPGTPPLPLPRGRGSEGLTVDARAAAWRVAVGSPGASLRVVDALRAVARAERLYWRPLDDGWILAASPGDPRPFSLALLRRKAMEAAFPMFERLAQTGTFPKDLLALLVAGERRSDEYDAEDTAALGRLLAVGQPFKGDKGASAAFFARPQLDGATVKAGLSMHIQLVRSDGQFGYGVTLP